MKESCNPEIAQTVDSHGLKVMRPSSTQPRTVNQRANQRDHWS